MEDYQLNCKLQENHSGKWLFTTSLTDVTQEICLACIILNLENRHSLNIRKIYYLSVLCNIMHADHQSITNTFEKDEKVSLHTLTVLLDLSCEENERIAGSASDCLLLFLFHLNKEELRVAVILRLTIKIQEEVNYLNNLGRIRIIGRLLHLFPCLVSRFFQQNTDVLHYLASGMVYPSDEVRMSITYVFLQIYSTNEKNTNAMNIIDIVVSKGILCLLKTCLMKDLMKNILALLKLFVASDNRRILLLFENSNEDINFPALIKKLILSPEINFQVSIIQCLCHILSVKILNEIQFQALLDENIPEVLLEILTGKNELLIESVLCLLLLFSKHPLCYERCVTYGITIVIDVALHLLSLKNWKLLHVAYDLIISTISNDVSIFKRVSHNSIPQLFLQMIENTLKVQGSQMLLPTCILFSLIMKKDVSLPFSQTTSIFHLSLQQIHQFLKGQLYMNTRLKENIPYELENMPLELKVFSCGLNVIYNFISMVQHHQNSLIIEEKFSCPFIDDSKENSNTILQTSIPLVMQECILTLDKTFIPFCLWS
ncbi:meiosis inhibitor protein 1-like [Parasteatoda tepidariorum]|uniref:meiosis inhibitor protein 1-like n=1 Tax=Parasteatoda tepidariorum TaxID=114398 RepID=UPI0039BCCEA0